MVQNYQKNGQGAKALDIRSELAAERRFLRLSACPLNQVSRTQSGAGKLQTL